MNNNKKYLSLGNIFNNIKMIANGNSAMQSEIFCTLFNENNINATTVNNYCIGIRAIGVLYKRKYIVLKNQYEQDKDVFIDIILSLISILNEYVYIKNDKSIEIINSNSKLKELCIKLLDISCNDNNIDNEFTTNISKLIDNNNLYECIIELLCYAIIDNKQPIYTQVINIKINKDELEEYLKIKMYEGVSFITSLIYLSKKDNMYACADLGSFEFDGLVSGDKNYEKSFYYYMKAAKKNHPKACWMIANMIMTNRVDYNFDTFWYYLNKSIELGSAAGLNTMGKCYLSGLNPNKEINKDKAIHYFKLSSEMGYTYAFNNLGKMYENDGNIEEAIKYYKLSADLGESWALNKVGEYYRSKGDKDTALVYYIESNNAPISERCKWSSYNIERYY